MSITELSIIRNQLENTDSKAEIDELLQEIGKPFDSSCSWERLIIDTENKIQTYYIDKDFTIQSYFPEEIRVEERKRKGVILKDADAYSTKGQISIFKEVIAHLLREKLDKEVKKTEIRLQDLRNKKEEIEGKRIPTI